MTSSITSKSNSASAYKKLSHREHVLQLPDTYIGSVESAEEWRWILDDAGHMVFKQIRFNPGFYKIFDELIVNARDALVRSRTETGRTPIKKIDITCVKEDDANITIGVTNDGDGIPIEEHPTEKCYVPELIFGHLLTSGNYNKEEEKIVGGKNGYGAKLTNIFSKQFTVQTQSPKHGKKYSQKWSNNMSVVEKPSVSKGGATGYVSVTYTPDVSRFPGMDVDAMMNVLHTRTVELAALAGKEVKVSWNGSVIPTNTFEKFVRLFLKEEGTHGVVYEACGPRWEVAAVLSRSLYEEEGASDFKHVSFVNGINTRRGGKHVDTVSTHILSDFCEAAAKKKVAIKPSQLKDSVVFFINATIVNPSFDSQTKETLTTPAKQYGSVFKTEGKLVDGLMKIGLLEEAREILDAKAAKDAKKTDGSKKRTLRGFPKLEDALWAGTAKSKECTLILTEGDSAATSAISGLEVVGRERFGIFPLKGKVLNVKDISQEKFNKNEELTAIKAILGLRQGMHYKDLSSLRYGRVMVMADQDHDGSHIKGLIMNLFHTEWPELMKMGFLCSLATPLLKASRRGTVLSFYSMPEFERWKETEEGKQRGWTLKYYKGLGTSTPAEAREWFKKMAEIHYVWDDSTDETISLAFNKKRADDRKEWLAGYTSNRTIDISGGARVEFSRFVNDELIHFSNEDNTRSLPSVMDGLKPSQRKILFGCFKRGLTDEVRVAQLAGYVSEHAAYHHGEASLTATITAMAQDFVGSNNLNLLAPIGQFGSRLLGGKDAASPRYIHTHLAPIIHKVYRKEDTAILRYLNDDDMMVEPDYYLPILPMLLVNGCVGIGTGFSTDIPPYNPMDLVRVLKERLLRRLPSMKSVPLKPWWFGFTGEIVSGGEGTWITKGKYTLNDEKHTITITELPVGVWTKDYKAFLDEMAGAEKKDGKAVGNAFDDDGNVILKNFDDLYTDTLVKFVLYFTEDTYEDMKAHPVDFEKRFRLTSSWKTTNMVAFNKDSKITRYESVGDILEGFYGHRLDKYEERRLAEIMRLEKDADIAENTAKFLKSFLEGRIDLRRCTDEQIVQMMKKEGIAPLSNADAAESIDAYDYVLRLRMDRVKQSAIDAQEAAVVSAQQALQTLRETTASQMWLRELDEFESAWGEYTKERMEAAKRVASSHGSTSGKKAIYKKKN